MRLTALDWAVVAAYFLLNLGVGFYYYRRAGLGLSELFVSGRDVPILTTGVTSAVWLAVTYLTPPEPASKLVSFFQRARPGGPGWRPVAAEALSQGPRDLHPESLGWSLADWGAGCALIYGALFGVGKVIFQEYAVGLLLLLGALLAAGFIYWDLSRRGWQSLS